MFYKGWPKFIEKWNDVHDEFETLKQQALDSRDLWEREYLDECAHRAAEAWEAIMATNGQDRVLILELPNSTKVFGTVEEFMNWIVEIGRGNFPSSDNISRNLRADFYTAVLISTADIQAETTREQEQQALELLAHTRKEEAHARRAKAEQQQRVAESEADLAMKAIYDAQLEHARHQLRTTVSPFEELFQNLRSQIYHDAREMADSIRRNGFLNPQVGKRIHNLIDLFKMKDAVGDMELDRLLHTVEEWANQTPKQTGKAGEVMPADRVALAQLGTALDDVVTATHEAARAVAERLERGADIAAVEI
jgi:hypothetical protein